MLLEACILSNYVWIYESARVCLQSLLADLKWKQIGRFQWNLLYRSILSSSSTIDKIGPQASLMPRNRQQSLQNGYHTPETKAPRASITNGFESMHTKQTFRFVPWGQLQFLHSRISNIWLKQWHLPLRIIIAVCQLHNVGVMSLIWQSIDVGVGVIPVCLPVIICPPACEM